MNKNNFSKYIIGFQGLYYLVTGLWAIFALEHFEKIVGHAHQGIPFEMYSISAMAVVLGIFYIYSIKKKNWNLVLKDIAYLVIGINLSIIIVEIFFFSYIVNTLFLIDLIEEIIITILLAWSIWK